MFAEAPRTASGKITASNRAGLKFPVGRVGRYMRKMKVAPRVSPFAAVYMSSVLEYLVAEMLELGGNAATDRRAKRITPRDLLKAVRGDTEIDALLRNVTIAGGGVLPNIHRALLPHKKSAAASQ